MNNGNFGDLHTRDTHDSARRRTLLVLMGSVAAAVCLLGAALSMLPANKLLSHQAAASTGAAGHANIADASADTGTPLAPKR